MDANGRFLSLPAASLAISLLIVSSLTLTLGFACALPLAAFATMAALMFEMRGAIAAMLAVWLVNQFVGFTIRHYPIDFTTIAWGCVLGALGLASWLPARLVYERLSGWMSTPAAFLASFYQHGLAEFAYRNGISLQDRCQFLAASSPPAASIALDLPRRTCVPISSPAACSRPNSTRRSRKNSSSCCTSRSTTSAPARSRAWRR